MRKRILATLLAFVLLFSGGAVTAYAYNVAVSGGLKSTPYSLRWVPSRVMRKLVCRLWLNEVSRQ